MPRSGLINIDQNNILKIFSVVTVFLLPPSVIGAVFGMNFSKMPWLHEDWGFWAAMGVMLCLGHRTVCVLQAERLAVRG